MRKCQHEVFNYTVRFSALLLILLLTSRGVLSQSSFIPLNEDYYHWIDRYETKNGRITPYIFTGLKPYKRSDVIQFIDTLQQRGTFTSTADQFNYNFMSNDSWEWSAVKADSRKPILKHFYKKKPDLIYVQGDDFDLHINPVLAFGAGNDSRRDEMLFVNTRGIEARGMVDKKLGFYTFLSENQILLPHYVRSYSQRVVHEGFFKRFKDGEAVDFLQARGYITFDASKHVQLQLGHDRFFIGNGFRSLIFSDFSPPVLFLRTNVKFWKLNYLFQVNQMTAETGGIDGFPLKYNALHQLSINIGSKFNLGIFESVIFSRGDSTGGDHFRLDYLNPVIFYRAIEQQNGSTDNVLVGIDVKWLMVKGLSLYGQFVVDELVVNNLRSGNGWWANKFAVQLGAKYINVFGIDNLDLQGEVNYVRPFTYTHHTNFGNYSNYRQPIAHPMGANFTEFAGILRWQVLSRLNITGKAVYIQTGRDSLATNTWGGNILLKNQLRVQEFNNKTGQGIANDIFYGSLTVSWMPKHNLFIDASAVMRKSVSELSSFQDNSKVFLITLRLNLPQRLYEF